MFEKISSEYEKIWNTLKQREWTSLHSLLIICFVLLAIVFSYFFCVFSTKLGDHKIWFTFALLSCSVTFSITILVGIKICMPYFMKKAEDNKNRENKILSMIQKDYEDKKNDNQ